MSAEKLKNIFSDYTIGISGELPEKQCWKKTHIDLAINELIADFCLAIFKYGGRIVHDCHPIFTPIIMHQAEIHATIDDPVTLVCSEYLEDTCQNLSKYKKLARVITTKSIRNSERESLALMRKTFIEEASSLVVFGGRRDLQNNYGLGEELCFALRRGLPVFAIGNTGGMLDEIMEVDEIKRLVFASNLMTDKQNNELLKNDDVVFAAGDVLGHITKQREQFRNMNVSKVNVNEACPGLQTVLQDLQLSPEAINKLFVSVKDLAWHTQIVFLKWLKSGINSRSWDTQNLLDIFKNEAVNISSDDDGIIHIVAQTLKTSVILFNALEMRELLKDIIFFLKRLDDSRNWDNDYWNIATKCHFPIWAVESMPKMFFLTQGENNSKYTIKTTPFLTHLCLKKDDYSTIRKDTECIFTVQLNTKLSDERLSRIGNVEKYIKNNKIPSDSGRAALMVYLLANEIEDNEELHEGIMREYRNGGNVDEYLANSTSKKQQNDGNYTYNSILSDNRTH